MVIDLNRVVDEIDGDQRLHSLDVVTATRHLGAHCRKVDQRRHTAEVL